MPWYKQSGAFQRRAAVNHQLRWPFARGDGDLPLPKPVRDAILASKRPGIWRMSDYTKRGSQRHGGSCVRDCANSSSDMFPIRRSCSGSAALRRVTVRDPANGVNKWKRQNADRSATWRDLDHF